jgi:hypothetical protein
LRSSNANVEVDATSITDQSTIAKSPIANQTGMTIVENAVFLATETFPATLVSEVPYQPLDPPFHVHLLMQLSESKQWFHGDDTTVD